MGYSSDVVIGVAFKTRKQMEEVLAVYRMDPKVQKHNVMEKWKLCPDHEPPYMVFTGNDVKWYDSYEDVQAFEHIASVCEDFADERGFEYAYRIVRIGEEDTDVDVDDSYDNDDYDLMDFLQDNLYPIRRIDCDL